MAQKLLVFIQTPKRRLIASLILNTIFLLLILLVMVPVFESNDDTAIMDLVNGARGFMDYHLVFINCIMGFFIKLLYQLLPYYPWYGIVEYGAAWIGFIALTYVILERQPNWLGVSVSLVLLAYFGYDCYTLLQFTKIAAVPTCGGVLLVLHGASQNETPNWLYIVLGTLLSCIGSMYRFLQFLSVTALLSGIGIYVMLIQINENRRVFRKRLCSCILALVILFGVNISLRIFDQWIYRCDPEWESYIEYNITRARLLDYGLPDYDEHKDTYKNLGIGEAAFELFSNWNNYDPDIFTVETMNKIILLRNDKPLSISTANDFARDVFPQFLKYPMLNCILILLAYWIIWGRRSKIEIFAFVFQITVFMAIYFYMYLSGRYLIPRVDFGLFMALAVFMAYLATAQESEIIRINKPGILSINLALFLICMQFYQETLHINMQYVLDNRQEDLLSLRDIASDHEHLYLGKNDIISSESSYGPLDIRPRNEIVNRGYFGGWSCNVPPILDIMKKYGVINPYRDCIDNEKVYVIDNDIELTMEYIKKNYNKKANARLVRAVGACGVYQITTR